MFARTQCRYLYIYTVYLYANKADSSCSSRGSNTEAAADYSYAPLAHKLNCIKIINGITRVSVARCVSTHAHPSPAHTPPHTPPHTPLVHTQVRRQLQSKASLAQFLIIIYEACRQGETRRQTAADAALLLVHAALALHRKHVAVFTSPHAALKSIGLHLPRFRFLISLLTPSSEAIALMERVLPQTQFCHCHAPLPPPLFFWQISACDLQISRQTELKMPTWVNCCLSKQLPTPAVSLPSSPPPTCHPATLPTAQLATQYR